MISEIKFINEISPEQSSYQYIYIDLVHRCNMECNNCYLPNRDYPDVNYENLIDFIDKFKQRTEFRLIGGEPTLYEKLPEVIKHIKGNKLNHRVTLVTNGLKLSSKKYVNLLKQSGLHRIYLSMNGFDNDDVYEKLDDLRCAKSKMSALNNIINHGIGMSIGFIVVKNCNEFLIDKMISYCNNKNIRMTFEFRNIGNIGRNMIKLSNTSNYTFDELNDIIANKFKFDKSQYHLDDHYSKVYKSGKFIIRINDWEIFDKPISDKSNILRGRMTSSFTVSPFLSHIKENEFGY